MAFVSRVESVSMAYLWPKVHFGNTTRSFSVVAPSLANGPDGMLCSGRDKQIYLFIVPDSAHTIVDASETRWAVWFHKMLSQLLKSA